MEKLKTSNQAIQKHDDDHVGKRGQDNAMTISAAERDAWQQCWSDDFPNDRPSSTCAPQQDSRRTIRARPADIPLKWRRSRFFGTLGYLLVLIASLWAIPASAVFIEFQNCLSQSYQNDEPLQLQFDPLFLDAVFNTTDSSHNLHITVWGNVTGSGPENLVVLPSPNNTQYWQGNETNLGGKIEDNPTGPSGVNKLTTLFNKVNVLTYEPWSQTVEFCNQLINASCPLAPSFGANA